MPKPMYISDIEKEVLLTLLKVECENATDAKQAVDKTFVAYLAFVKQLQSLKGDMRII